MPFNLEEHITKQLEFRTPLVICVSGGKDSTCLVHLISKRIEKFRSSIEIIHFNHQLRKDSQKDEDFVLDLAFSNNILFSSYKLDVMDFSKKTGKSIEESARTLRYEKLNEILTKRKEVGNIYTAHNATDQLETVLFRIIKGAGMEGLIGVRREYRLKCGWMVKRPLLDITPDVIYDYIKTNKIKFRYDSTNSNTDIPRNYLRKKIIKKLRVLNPSIEKSILRITDILSEEDRFLRKKIDLLLSEQKIVKKDGRIYIELEGIMSYNKVLKRRLIRRLSPVELDFVKVEAILKLISANTGSKFIELGESWKARKSRTELIFEKDLPPEIVFENEITIGSDIEIKEIAAIVRAEIVKNIPDDFRDKNTVYFDTDKINTENLILRSKKDGDKIKLWSLNGSKKLKDMFIDMKLSLEEKNEVVIIEEKGESESENRILWVSPYRRSDCAPVTSETKEVIKIQFKKENG